MFVDAAYQQSGAPFKFTKLRNIFPKAVECRPWLLPPPTPHPQSQHHICPRHRSPPPMDFKKSKLVRLPPSSPHSATKKIRAQNSIPTIKIRSFAALVPGSTMSSRGSTTTNRPRPCPSATTPAPCRGRLRRRRRS